MITGLRIFFLLLSLAGFMALLVEKFSLRIELTAAVTCAGISSVLLLAGYLNLLPLAVAAVWLAGAVLLILFGKKAFFHQRRNSAILLVWAAVLVGFALFMKGAHFLNYDNFSHWAAVVKCMLLENRMPNFKDEVITFQSYPLGSSVFVYYVCKVIGASEACQLFAQMLMSVSFLTSLLVFAEKPRIITVGVLAALFTVSSLVMSVSFLSLHVDVLMPLAGVAAFCITAIAEEEPDVIRSIWAVMPIYIFLVNVKNSGIFFVIICWAYWLIKNRSFFSSHRKRPIIHFAVCGVLAPLGSILLWKRHVALVFRSGAATKHSMSLEWFSSVLSEKTSQDIWEITTNMARRVFSINDRLFQVMLAATVLMVLILVQKLLKREPLRKSVLTIAGLWGVWFVYVVSLLAMYVFSMPMAEAATLASFDKYMSSAVLFVLGIALIQVFRYWSSDRVFWGLIFACVFLFPLYQFRDNLPRLYTKQDYESTGRYRFQEFLKESKLESGRSYFIYRSENDSGYLFYLARYELWSSRVNVTYGKDGVEKFKDVFPERDYLLVWEQDEYIQDYLKKVGLEEYISDAPVAIPMKDV